MMDKIIGSDGAKITHFINIDEGEVLEVDDKETDEMDEMTEIINSRLLQEAQELRDATKKEDEDKKEAEQKQPTKPMSEDKDEL